MGVQVWHTVATVIATNHWVARSWGKAFNLTSAFENSTAEFQVAISPFIWLPAVIYTVLLQEQKLLNRVRCRRIAVIEQIIAQAAGPSTGETQGVLI